MMGRPSSYTAEIAEEICNRLSLDESLVAICRDDHMPHVQTVFRWVRDNEAFRADYARARVDQGHTAADGLSDIRKAILSGEIDHQTGTAVAKIAQWEAARRAPKDYGDKLDVTSGGERFDWGQRAAKARDGAE